MCSTNKIHCRVPLTQLKRSAPALTALFAVLALAGCGKTKKAEPRPAAKAATPIAAPAPAASLPPCDRAHTELVDHDGKNGLDLVCHDSKGRHAVAIRKPDGSFLPTVGWWPSPTSDWCRPESLRSGDYNGDQKLDMSCHSKDGKHLVAFANGDGTFSPGKWWPSPPGTGEGWCDPASIKLGHYDNDE
ncbi:MAG TPA: VCBS repeat-containing protein, partial [Polyangiaceae bacterium]|nr:VCBS repeat-containing protein [Polyangiaceae bacterium]